MQALITYLRLLGHGAVMGPLSSSGLASHWEVLLRMDKILKVSRTGNQSQRSGTGFVAKHVFVSMVPIP